MNPNPKKNRRLDYFPILSFFLFWFFSALAGALKINDPGILKLGLFTIPAVAAMILSLWVIARNHRLREAAREEREAGGDHAPDVAQGE